MGMVVVSTDYQYEYQGHYIRVKIGMEERTAIISFFYGNTLVYYKPVNNVDCEIITDVELIQKVITEMPDDQKRWLPGLEKECAWIAENFHKMISTHRVGGYKFQFDDIDTELELSVTESWDGHVKMRFASENSTDRISCDFDVSNGSDIIKRSEDYSKMLLRMVEVFKGNASEIRKATCSKNVTIENAIAV